jgi:serine/threonine protein kinase
MKLNLNSLTQRGGVIINFNDKLIKVNDKENDIMYKSLISGSNEFKYKEMKSLYTFINFVLPYISFNGKNLGLDSIKNIETVGAGTFGVTLIYDDLAIKIMTSPEAKIRDENQYKEIDNLENISDISNPPPDSIIKYYGFISNKNFAKLSKFNNYTGNLNVYSNLFSNPLFKFNESEYLKTEDTLKIDPNIKSLFLDKLVIIFLEKGDMDVYNYLLANTELLITEKIKLSSVLLNNMIKALEYLHGRRLVHCDIKLDNIIIKQDKTTGQLLFKLIDFGSITKIDDNGYIVGDIRTLHIARTRDYYINTFHDANITYLYDYYCVILTIFQILGVNRHNFNQIGLIKSKLIDLKKKCIKGMSFLNEIIKFINDLLAINLPLPESLPSSEEKKNIIKFYAEFIKYLNLSYVVDNFVPAL